MTAANANPSVYWEVFDTLIVSPWTGGATGTLTRWVMFQDCISELTTSDMS